MSVVRLASWILIAGVGGLSAATACSVDDDYVFGDDETTGAAGDDGAASGGTGAVSGSQGGASSEGSGGASSTTGGTTAGGSPSTATGATSNGGNGSSGAPSSPPGKLRGAKCSADADCADGHCVDGVCCESACDGGCQACVSSKTAQPDGSCAGVRSGTDPDDECAEDDTPCGLTGTCNGAGGCLFASPNTECSNETCEDGEYTPVARCDGLGTCVPPAAVPCNNCVDGVCEAGCSGSADCESGFYCAGGACAAKKANGAACAQAGECTSNFCVEGVCCDGACGDNCYSCLLENTGEPDGKCTPSKSGTLEPSCVATTPDKCGHDGTCDGKGYCRYHAQGTLCYSENCVDEMTARVSSACNGRGACAPVETVTCGNYRCYGGCPISCTGNETCRDWAFCENTRCVDRKPLGADCDTGRECVSGSCSFEKHCQ